MIALVPVALRSVRHRLRGFAATVVAITASAFLVGTFAGLAESALAPGVPSESSEILVIMGLVIGAWGAVLALFALVSTLGVAVRRRDAEMRTLRAVGATTAQTRGLVQAEVIIVGLAAATLGVLFAWPAGRAILGLLRDAGMVSPDVEYTGGPASLGTVVALVTVVSALAAGIAASGRMRTPGLTRRTRSRRLARLLGGAFLVLVGLSAAAMTVLVAADEPNPYLAMATSGNAGLLVGVGTCAVAPALLGVAARFAVPLSRRFGAPGELAADTSRRRSHLLATVLGAAITLTAASSGVLMLRSIDERTFTLPPDMSQSMADTITLLNDTIVAMIAGFSLLILVNSIVAVMDDRAGELAGLRRLGATPGQLRRMIAIECAIVGTAGALIGTVCSLATIIPFSVARNEGVVPDGQLWLPPVVAVSVIAITIGAGLVALTRSSGAIARLMPGRAAA